MKVIAYLRISKEKQDIDNQKFGIDEYCRKNGIEVTAYIKEVAPRYKKNKKFWPVIDELLKGDMIIVSELSRVAGSVQQSFEFMKLCLDKGIKAYFVKQNLSVEDTILTEAIMFGYGLAARIERDLISERTKEALARKKKEAELRGERFKIGRPVGFKVENRKLDDKKEKIEKMLEERVSILRMSKILNCHRNTLNNYIEERISQ